MLDILNSRKVKKTRGVTERGEGFAVFFRFYLPKTHIKLVVDGGNSPTFSLLIKFCKSRIFLKDFSSNPSSQ